METLCRHRCPLRSAPDVGLTPTRAVAVDSLHCFYLGVMAAFCKALLWTIFESRVWGDLGTEGENIQVAVQMFRSHQTAWYKQRAQVFPQERLTRLGKFSRKSVGTRNNQEFKAKAAETWCVMLFLLDQVRRFGERLGMNHQRLLRAGECLERIVMIWREHKWIIPRPAQEESWW